MGAGWARAAVRSARALAACTSGASGGRVALIRLASLAACLAAVWKEVVVANSVEVVYSAGFLPSPNSRLSCQKGCG